MSEQLTCGCIRDGHTLTTISPCPAHSQYPMPDQPTDAGKDARTADRLVDDWVADCVAVEAQRSIALALSAARAEGARQEREAIADLVRNDGYQSQRAGNQALANILYHIATVIELRARAREPREEPR